MIDIKQHRIASGVIALVGLWVCYISFTQEPAEAYLFPRIVSVGFVLMSLLTFVKALMGRSKVGEGLSMEMFRNMAAGILVGGFYGLFAAKFFGFYISTMIMFFVLLSLYDPGSHGEVRVWVKRVCITVLFVIVMYALFALTLNVYTPRGLLI